MFDILFVRAKSIWKPDAPAKDFRVLRWRVRLRGKIDPLSAASLFGGGKVGEDLGGAIGVVDGIERGIAYEFFTDDGHGQALQANTCEGPLLGQLMCQAGFVIPFDTA